MLCFVPLLDIYWIVVDIDIHPVKLTSRPQVGA